MSIRDDKRYLVSDAGFTTVSEVVLHFGKKSHDRPTSTHLVGYVFVRVSHGEAHVCTTMATFETILQPLTLTQGFHLLALYAALPAGIQLADAASAIARALRRTDSSLSAYTADHLVLVVRQVIQDLHTFHPSVLQRHRPAIEYLAEEGGACCACPLVNHCLECHGVLTTVRRNTAAFFYSDTAAPQSGLSYYKHCEGCLLVYGLHGYSPQANAHSRHPYQAHHHLYPADLDSTVWEEVTSETYVSYALLKRHCAEVMHSHVSTQAAAAIENYRFDSGMHTG